MEFLKNRQDLRNVDIAGTWKLLLTEKEIHHCIDKCAAYINKNFLGKDIVLTAVLKGAVYFFVDLSRRLTIPHSTYFIEASSYHNSQSQDEKIEVLSRIIPSKFENKHVILIDELFDSGNTIEKVKQAIHENAGVPLEMIFTCTLFNKNKTKSPDLCGINVPNVWLVGWGLDDNQEKRGWTELFACPKCKSLPKSEDDVIFDDNASYEEVRNRLTMMAMKKLN